VHFHEILKGFNDPFRAREKTFTVFFYGGGMKAASTVKTWEKTRLANLVRHRSGRYYARAYTGGKEVWKSLKTSHFSVAEAKLAKIESEATAKLDQATESAKASPTPAVESAMTDVWADGGNAWRN